MNEEIKKSFNFRKTKGKELDNIRQQLKENYKTITAKYRDNNTSIIFVDNKTKVAGGWVCKLPENYKIPVRYENKKVCFLYIYHDFLSLIITYPFNFFCL